MRVPAWQEKQAGWQLSAAAKRGRRHSDSWLPRYLPPLLQAVLSHSHSYTLCSAPAFCLGARCLGACVANSYCFVLYAPPSLTIAVQVVGDG